MKLNVVLAGATGMVGQGALQQCLASDQVDKVLTLTRRPLESADPKHGTLVHEDFTDLSPIADQLTGYNACLYAVGVSSYRMNEAEYTQITKQITLVMARQLLESNPDEMSFCFVSAHGANSQSSVMWERIKGETEDELRNLPFKRCHIMRPAYIQPGQGTWSRTRIYNLMLAGTRYMYPLIRTVFPEYTCTSEQLGNAMINSMTLGYDQPVIEGKHIRRFGSL